MVYRLSGSAVRRAARERFQTNVPRISEVVFVPPNPLLPIRLHQDVESRRLMASRDGFAVASIRRTSGSSLVVVHSDPAVTLAANAFDDAMIVQTFPHRGVRVWGDYSGTRGIWMVTPQGVRLCARMQDVQKFIRGPWGDIPVGSVGRGGVVCLVRESAMTLPGGVELVFDRDGRVHTLLPHAVGSDTFWYDPPDPDWNLPDNQPGKPVWPLPFVARRARMFLHHGRPVYLLRDGNSDSFWVGGRLTPITPEGTDGGVDFVWPAPDSSSVALLLRVASRDNRFARRLLVDGKTVFEGSFFMRSGGFRWSPDGRQFVAHVTRTDSDGNRAEEILVTRDQCVAFSRPAMIHEPTIDDRGRLSYVLDAAQGRRLVAGDVSTEAYPYAWNLSCLTDAVAANVLTHGRIERVELAYDR
ncbi:hypothetical protein A2348_02780 [Candidatus Uhrbacteria bacterium RIFOXYB12_FULL_58_10]|uniref:Uncharacterized protein n=1 Tax=Candidatus Uhrbacteria bacterium RIFOXYB2_FULL_57_15 TaxID=1802422 RepID=A0A1F7W8P7_9BACT|nr:MAG: hypothetical protein A2348_02780 [Candidatus Uhrbacteria bacterium RIFOXYB12_FULL_58_10]OGL98464.1 MAG: hypothetical protein A2304_02110 [Candidatus Uhrbacteria bacterium RIFOXYB2_FULL_57_15]